MNFGSPPRVHTESSPEQLAADWKAMQRAADWTTTQRALQYHDLPRHILVPLWARVPERARWAVAHFLNRSQRWEWCTLVDAALKPTDGDDPCDGKLPTMAGLDGPCRNVCGWLHNHSGGTQCACYCGKFTWSADR